MMLITGPLWSGKRAFACRVLGCTPEELSSRAVWDAQDLAADCENLEALAEELSAREAVLMTEVGAGVVPADPAQRASREAAGRLACLLAAPVRRTTVACTQLLVLLTGEVLLLGYCTALEYAVAELMFPGDYIENVPERMSLYRELDSIEREDELLAFERRLEDRFGKPPRQVSQLMLVVRLRWQAVRYGVERLVLKNERMTAFLVANPASPYYRSDEFGALLRYATQNPYRCKLREQDGRRSIVFSGITTIEEAYGVFQGIDALRGA